MSNYLNGGVTVAKCVFLSTYDEFVECFKECPLYNWEENDNKCPFKELKINKKVIKSSYDYDYYRDDKDLNVASIYKDNYI